MRQSLGLPQSSLSVMRNLKTNPVSARPSANRAEPSNSKKAATEADQAIVPAYPTIWKKAFALGQNVRFTRTPEVELLRKRIENDPGFAEKMKAFAAEQKRRRENASRNSMEIIEQQQTKSVASDPISEKAIESASESDSITAVPMLEPEESDILAEIFEDSDSVTDNTAPTLTHTNKPLYLSDSAFFEVGPFLFDNIHSDASQADQLHSLEKNSPVQAGNIQPHTDVKVDNHSSITDLYRVLECRFSKNRHQQESQSNIVHEPVVSTDGEQVETGVTAPIQTVPQTSSQVHEQITGQNSENVHDVVQHDNVMTVNVHEIQVSGLVDKTVENDTFNQSNETIAEPEIQAPVQHVVEDVKPVIIDDTETSNVVPEIHQTVEQQAVASMQNESHRAAPTLAKISAPFRTLNPAFIPSPKADHDGSYVFPSIDLLQQPVYQDGAIISQETLERSAGLLESVLEDFGIKGEIIHVRPGPVVTMYEFEPAAGVKSSRVIGLSDDIARSMSAISARVAVIPGRNVIGIELPNKVRETVYLRELIQSKAFQDSNFKLPLALGKNIGGEPVIAELAKMPHLLVAGTTGSGKSVAINAMILSLLYRLKPEQCRLIMVDPKMLELSIYDGIPHLLTPVVTDPKKAVTALKWAVREMEDRYRKMAKLGVRNIDGFNARVATAVEKGETITCTVQSGFDKETGEMLYHEEAMDLSKLPYIVVIVDEMADLMMVAGKEIEGAIQRLAQMARAAGIHLIMATQRPSVDVITGTIKANFPTRISFQVTSKIDSRTILGEQGAETLLGQGDMLHMVGGGRIVRVHGPFVSDEEVEHVVAHLKTQGTPDYLATVTDGEDEEETIEDADSIADIVAAGNAGENAEELYLQAVKVVMRDKKCSTSYIQRRLAIGYNKAASLVERMEEEGIVGPANHVGKREILLNHGRDSF